jgi:saccharopine dehydrogenase-like NADP-dependent oxidoreductase
MTKAIVLGAGMVGSLMAADMARDGEFEVTIADVRPDALRRAQQRASFPLRAIEADLSDPAILSRTIAPFDIVLGAMASRFGQQTLRTVIEARKNYCDITFMAEDAIDLDPLARQHGVTAVVDCGVAPGMSNLLAGHGATLLDECTSIEIYVGGLPRVRTWPYQYKAAFSPADVIEEYTRPARMVEHGRIVVREALSEPELMNLPGVGTVEAFNTDGLRSLAYTMRHVPFMKEKTLRWPGHIELMRAMRETGLFSHEPVRVSGADVRPIDLVSALMFPKWMYEPGEEDLTVMRVIVEGRKGEAEARHVWDMLDVHDRVSGWSSMARTTAFPCTIVARMIARGEIAQPGVLPPELLAGNPGLADALLAELLNRGVRFEHRIESKVNQKL